MSKKILGDEKLGIVFIAVGLIGVALLFYLFYVLFRGDEL